MGPENKRPERFGAQGAIWRRIVAKVVERDSGICHICNHAGAKSGDHVIPVTERPDLARSASNIKAAHGVGSPCPVCSKAAGKRIHCNNIKGGYSLERARRLIEQRTGLKLNEQVTPADKQGREW